jgi:hypothetical protein
MFVKADIFFFFVYVKLLLVKLMKEALEVNQTGVKLMEDMPTVPLHLYIF